ncbi:hypothetical protein CZP2022_48 [Vibrio phage C-ZP2022]|nr:hypothetical protein [Vibrio phage vB_pir03]UKZ10771.1 hypothetical protein CZP2022_48 [Vibrio phage C-ZP2022]
MDYKTLVVTAIGILAVTILGLLYIHSEREKRRLRKVSTDTTAFAEGSTEPVIDFLLDTAYVRNAVTTQHVGVSTQTFEIDAFISFMDKYKKALTTALEDFTDNTNRMDSVHWAVGMMLEIYGEGMGYHITAARFGNVPDSVRSLMMISFAETVAHRDKNDAPFDFVETWLSLVETNRFCYSLEELNSEFFVGHTVHRHLEDYFDNHNRFCDDLSARQRIQMARVMHNNFRKVPAHSCVTQTRSCNWRLLFLATWIHEAYINVEFELTDLETYVLEDRLLDYDARSDLEVSLFPTKEEDIEVNDLEEEEALMLEADETLTHLDGPGRGYKDPQTMLIEAEDEAAESSSNSDSED